MVFVCVDSIFISTQFDFIISLISSNVIESINLNRSKLELLTTQSSLFSLRTNHRWYEPEIRTSSNQSSKCTQKHRFLLNLLSLSDCDFKWFKV